MQLSWQKSLNSDPGERGAQVGYDPIGYSEPVCDLLGELSCLGGRHSCDGFDLNPLGELVDGDEYMGIAALRCF